MSYQYGSYHRVQNLTSPASSVYNYYDSLRGTLSSKYNYATPSWNTVSSYVYGTPNAIGQRTSVDAYGTAFSSSDTADWQWKYNLRGELASARNQPLQASSTASRFYEFDGIGNRQRQRQGVFADAGGTLTSYTPNALNQYTTITTASTVYPYHDPDGNMTSGPLPTSPTGASLGWNGENRLSYISPWVSGSAWAYYLHDALGRRVMKTVTPSGGSATRTYAIYDGWNLLAEYTGAVHTTGTPPLATLQRSYAWGTDLSGTAQGAGGVGGLLAAQLHTGPNMGVYYPTYDGNGNVSEYLNSTGGVAAHYEYGPFGEPLVSTGSVATQMPFRFSTKYHDTETGLYYYGYRYYDPNTGRWLSRDPIGEQGGVNLYGMVGNDPINLWDLLGLEVEIRSPTWMRVAIPGQVAWDDAQTHWHNGRYGYASASTGLMLVEQVFAILTFGDSMIAKQGSSIAVRQGESAAIQQAESAASCKAAELAREQLLKALKALEQSQIEDRIMLENGKNQMAALINQGRKIASFGGLKDEVLINIPRRIAERARQISDLRGKLGL
jgi:RHS repeat-associated protein